MKLNYTYLFLLAATYLLIQCVPVTPDPVLTVINRNVEDPLLKKISYYQDQQVSDSLVALLSHKDPTYRYAAAMAFASIEDKDILDSLAVLLKDTLVEVRMAAAHAIGQQGDLRGEKFLVGAFEGYDSLKQYQQSNGAILEAVGRCASRDFLSSLSSISTYSHTDTFLVEGQARGIYRYSLRKMVVPEGTSKMLEFVNNQKYPQSVRVIAANYLGRTKDIDLNPNVAALAETFERDKDPRVRMALALALSKITQPGAVQSLLKQLESESDYRVKCNIIRALKSFEYDAVKAAILVAVDDKNPHVALTAAQFFVSNGVPQEAAIYRKKAKETPYAWPVWTAFYEAANRHLPPYMANTRAAMTYELKNKYTASTNPHERAALLKTLAEHGWNYKFIYRELALAQTLVEKTAIIEALGKITADLDYYKTFGGNNRRVTREISNQLLQVMRSGDVGMMAVAAGVLRNENIDFKTLLRDSLSVIKTAQQELDLPKSIETYNEVQKALDFLQGKELSKPKRVALNHPIDTTQFTKLEGIPNALIQTNRGAIKIQLLPLLAPASVLNFMQLAESGFYKDKTFHRVVPNFVVQAGCPRGDGYGSLDYTLRSELPLAYYDEEGYVGMASAGKHTEGTQFFITHSPTPHLDGNYTIFGKVTEGMRVVHQLEVGDVIERVTIEN